MHPDLLGWAAAALMVATFSCHDARWLRPLAVLANVAFIGYGGMAGLAPVLALHALLLPINLWRWAQAIDVRGQRLALRLSWRARTAALLVVVPALMACGLLLDERANSITPVPAGEGRLTQYRNCGSGSPHDVRAKTQPGTPIQVCSVAQGSGMAGAAKAASIAASCAARLPPAAGPDTSFGDGGRATGGRVRLNVGPTLVRIHP
jgi:hypothetical protein